MDINGRSAPPSALYTGSASTSTTGTRFLDLTNDETGNTFAVDLATAPTPGAFREPYRGLWLQNQDDTDNLFLKHVAGDDAAGWRLQPADKEFIPLDQIEQLYVVASANTPILGVILI